MCVSFIKVCLSQQKIIAERCRMSTQMLPAASLRRANRLPAARTLSWWANYWVCMALWSIGRAIFHAASNFLPALREGRAEAGCQGRAALTSAALPCRVRALGRGLETSPMHHPYRTQTCGELRLADAGRSARLSGWVHRKRDHGQLLFVDLRDHYGVTQCVVDVSSPVFRAADALLLESVVTLTGQVAARSSDTVNPRLPTGEVELVIAAVEVRSEAETLPFPVNTE